MAAQLRVEANAMFRGFPRHLLRALYQAVIEDPASPFRDRPEDSEWFGMRLQTSERPLSGIVLGVVGEAGRDALLRLLITKMRELDPRVVARDLSRGKKAGIIGFRNRGSPSDAPGTNIHSLPYDVGRHITGFLKNPADVGRTTDETLAVKRGQFAGTGGRRRTVKKRRT